MERKDVDMKAMATMMAISKKNVIPEPLSLLASLSV